MESLFVGVGDRRQPTPRPSQEGKTGDNPPLAPPPPRRGDMGMSEEVGAKFCLSIFLP
ncbi:MAG: hypothetical protein F6K25_15615 [Okeania sp. SIO2G4]|uniref:hypothetical protein n=1 Tax=unclassified Okeania TaxID=2634635 RepID=UPI0013BE75F6|nr:MULTISPECIES: hypothetical protein [unclassified Okeania]NEP45426.1 hypothetical protein [Okeania sp. SIO2H7]NEP73409.1 hypothetical protein [Okeania sp. SIO2G5]NEP96459.1 hypothetical protein [Okeania sp. SIO2F5]NEQ92048.1 hypothetical protein [Okeania sp. SIO2G4]